MPSNELLIAIQTHTKHQFVKVQDGVATVLDSNDVIPESHIAYQKTPPDGLYRMVEATCGGSCKVGTPKPDCVTRGIYSQRKCAVWFFESMDHVSITFDECESIVNEMGKGQ